MQINKTKLFCGIIMGILLFFGFSYLDVEAQRRTRIYDRAPVGAVVIGPFICSDIPGDEELWVGGWAYDPANSYLDTDQRVQIRVCYESGYCDTYGTNYTSKYWPDAACGSLGGWCGFQVDFNPSYLKEGSNLIRVYAIDPDNNSQTLIDQGSVTAIKRSCSGPAMTIAPYTFNRADLTGTWAACPDYAIGHSGNSPYGPRCFFNVAWPSIWKTGSKVVDAKNLGLMPHIQGGGNAYTLRVTAQTPLTQVYGYDYSAQQDCAIICQDYPADSNILIDEYYCPGPDICAALGTSKTSITQGESVRLAWQTSNVSSADLSNVGSVALNGTQLVSPAQTTTYTLTGDWYGFKVTSSVTITVSCTSVNGSCGVSTNTCTAGTFSDTVDGACANNWNCVGSCGGTTASCSTNMANGTACTSDSNSCTNDICSAGTCTHPAISGTHKECSGTTCVSGIANTSLMCTDGCTSNATCGGCNPATFNSSVSGIYNSSGTSKITNININQTYMIKCDFGVAGTPNIPPPSGCSFSNFSGTAALFNCTAPGTVQSLPRSCVLNNASPDYLCSQNQSIGNLDVYICTPNSTASCGSGSCAGTKTCASNGSGWGACSSNGTSCSDGNSCTAPDTCQNGSCSSGPNNPVNGTLSGWSPATCPVSCGGGTQTRTCTGASCGGDATCGGAALSQSCNTQSCNNSPSTTNLQVTQSDYCNVSWTNAIFSWTFSDPDGDSQSAYRVQADNNSSFSSPEVDSGKVISSSNSYATLPGKLSFNTTYYWQLKVWDSKDLSSSWLFGPSFATPKHAYPSIDFSWTPQNPTVNENTQFSDQSLVYGGAVKSAWFWTFQNASPVNSVLQNPLVKFLSTGAKSVTLKVTDSDGFICTGQKTLNTLLTLPEWKEIAPF